MIHSCCLAILVVWASGVEATDDHRSIFSRVQGTYGSVYRGECHGEPVAVKVMSLQRDTAEDIKREIKLMRECDCENIVAYRDAFLRDHEMRKMLWVSDPS